MKKWDDETVDNAIIFLNDLRNQIEIKTKELQNNCPHKEKYVHFYTPYKQLECKKCGYLTTELINDNH